MYIQYIHSKSVPLSITHAFLYVHMQLNVDSYCGETWSVLPWVHATSPDSCPQVSPDCPSFPTQWHWYNITIRRGDGASNQTKQVEANDFPPLNDSMVTITVIFDTPLPQGMLDVEVLKVNAVPMKRLNEKDTPVYTNEFQYWNSSSKVTGM